jgi:phospholipid/cholesterol/gamma-HCH transport system permease protein
MGFILRCQAHPDGSLEIVVSTSSSVSQAIDTASVMNALASLKKGSSVTLVGEQVGAADSRLLAWILAVTRECGRRELKLFLEGMPEQVHRQLALALSVPERKGARREQHRDSILTTVGKATIGIVTDLKGWLTFLGELLVSLWSFVTRSARVPTRDIWNIIDECGPGALPIVTLISTLVGVILAFIGAQQLRQFGAQIFVANLVSVAMLREMGAVMAGVIMAGRTGAAFAAQLGTMQVNEEIDALKTFGISPMQYLVVPRVLALVVMMPLLCVYADMLGILGGAVVSSLTLDISLSQYFNQAKTAVHLSDLWLGVFKSCVFGVLIAIAGCLSGIRCGRSASAVGVAVTSAVVSGIVAIVLSDALFAFVTELAGV